MPAQTNHFDTLLGPALLLQVLASVDDTRFRDPLYLIGIMLVPSVQSERPSYLASDVDTHPGLG